MISRPHPFLALLLLQPSLARAQGPLAEATAQLQAREAELVAFRHDVHRHPELSGAEARTAGLVAERLRALGFAVRMGVGGHGLVAVLHGAKPGPLVAFRADMDAVPSAAPDPVAFASETPGVRHICGHDVHTTIGLAIAEALAAARPELAGGVMLVFQPAEERATGARAMLADGVFRGEKPVAIYAVHTSPLEVGTLGTMAGGLMAGRDRLRVTIEGAGDVTGAAAAAERIVSAVNTVSPEEAMRSGPPDLVHVTGVTRRQLAPDTWEVTAGLSIADPGVRTRTRERLARELAALGRPDVRVGATYDAKLVAGVTNDSALVRRANFAIARTLGAGALVPITRVPVPFSEDFGSFQAQVPGVMWFLGVSKTAKGTRGMPHAPDYVADDGAIMVGARAMVAVILDRMGG